MDKCHICQLSAGKPSRLYPGKSFCWMCGQALTKLHHDRNRAARVLNLLMEAKAPTAKPKTAPPKPTPKPKAPRPTVAKAGCSLRCLVPMGASEHDTACPNVK